MWQPPNRQIISTPLKVAICPSASNPVKNFRVGSGSEPNSFVDPGITVTNYVGCGGAFTQSQYYDSSEPQRNGIIMEDTSLRFSNIEDVSYNSFLAAETVYFG